MSPSRASTRNFFLSSADLNLSAIAEALTFSSVTLDLKDSSSEFTCSSVPFICPISASNLCFVPELSCSAVLAASISFSRWLFSNRNWSTSNLVSDSLCSCLARSLLAPSSSFDTDAIATAVSESAVFSSFTLVSVAAILEASSLYSPFMTSRLLSNFVFSSPRSFISLFLSKRPLPIASGLPPLITPRPSTISPSSVTSTKSVPSAFSQSSRAVLMSFTT